MTDYNKVVMYAVITFMLLMMAALVYLAATSSCNCSCPVNSTANLTTGMKVIHLGY
jgi:hypothetical protein